MSEETASVSLDPGVCTDAQVMLLEDKKINNKKKTLMVLHYIVMCIVCTVRMPKTVNMY